MQGMDDFKTIFFTECTELLTDMEGRLLVLEEGSTNTDELNAIFRCAHSIKGGAGAFGLEAVTHFTHILEALLDGMRESRIAATREVIDMLLKSVDIVNQMLAAAQEGKDIPAGLGAEIAAALGHYAQGAVLAPTVTPSVSSPICHRIYEITFAPHEEIFTTGNEPLLILRELRSLGDAMITLHTERLPGIDDLQPTQCKLQWTIRLESNVQEEAIWEVFEFVRDVADIKLNVEEIEPVVIGTETQGTTPKNTTEESSVKAAIATSIRVDLEKVDRLVNMVGELVITEAMLRAKLKHLPTGLYTEFMQGIDELSHHTRELQEAVMAVRMQPVKSIFSRMPRIVRDTSTQLGKNIQLILSGENTEVDKTVIEQLGDPLTHMIRNSVDHGIETPDQRIWNDKPEQGTILLSAYHRSGRIIIEIQDDGAGINRKKVLAKAQEKGLVAADAVLTDEEIDHLIFLPGFSTAETVTNVSGRGVGMDVVKRNIESLGGTVHITNMPGKGSIFTVSLPLTLAILDGMIVRVGQENYIVPITNIIETLRPSEGEVHTIQGKSNVINVRNEFVPLVYLSRVFNVANAEEDPNHTLIVLVESNSQKMGLVVNELVGQQQVVIKSLEANSDPVKGISGATILGDGKVSLILEINELKGLCQLPHRNIQAA